MRAARWYGPFILSLTPAFVAAQTLTSLPPRTLGRDSIQVRVFADGAVRASVAGQGDGSTASAGSIGVSVLSARSQFTTQISVATANDTLRDGYGTSILVPASGGRLAAGLVDVRLPKVYRQWGVHTYASASSASWFTKNPQATDETIGVAIAGLGASLYREVINQPLGPDNSAAVLVDVGLAYRGLFGDIANSEQQATETKLRTLGTDSEHFIGLELGLTIQVNDVRAALGFFFFDTDATGLGDGQLVAAFSLQGGLLSWVGKRVS